MDCKSLGYTSAHKPFLPRGGYKLGLDHSHNGTVMALLWYGSWDNQTKQQQKKENHSQIGQIHVLLVLMKFQEGIMNNDTPKSIVGLFFPRDKVSLYYFGVSWNRLYRTRWLCSYWDLPASASHVWVWKAYATISQKMSVQFSTVT